MSPCILFNSDACSIIYTNNHTLHEVAMEKQSDGSIGNDSSGVGEVAVNQALNSCIIK